MRHLNKISSRILQFICQDLKEYKKIDNSNGNFMPLTVEVIGKINEVSGTGRLISLTHYGELNGDLMRDPEMIFMESEDICGNITYFPLEFRNDYLGVNNELMVIRDEKIIGTRPKQQSDATVFANTWMKNIKAQQNFKIKLKSYNQKS